MKDVYFLVDLERTIGYWQPFFWKQNRHGYTSHIEEAGIFTRERAEEICKQDFDRRTVLISQNDVFEILGKGYGKHR